MKKIFKIWYLHYLSERLAYRKGYLNSSQFQMLQLWRIFYWKKRRKYHEYIELGMGCRFAFEKALTGK